MLLSKLKIKSFKKISDIELNLTDVNILVGTNGSGKSSILQAVHFTCCVIRQAYEVNPGKTSTLEINELDYLPSDNYRALGHNEWWGNKSASPGSELVFSFTDSNDDVILASCNLRSARNNAGISVSGSINTSLSGLLRNKKSFFSAYIPGVSGIPNREDKKSKKVVMKSCSYGDSNVVLRNALLLLSEQDQENINLIQGWLSEIIDEQVNISVSHNNDNDLFISCWIGMNGHSVPMELIGTGFLQLIQVFTYILLFKPGVLLIDEPDTHLHPTAQEKLVKVLARIASERSFRILLSTHSPFIVRGAPASSNVFWLENGSINSRNRSQVELALGWGAFGKKILIISEDSNTEMLRKIISQWPEIEKFVAFSSGTGYQHIPSPLDARSLSETFGGMYKIFIHRDRDSLTPAEAIKLQKAYQAEGALLWLPKQSDIEAYFCEKSFISELLQCPIEDAEKLIDDILSQHKQQFRDQFNKQRAAHNAELYKSGGSPLNENVWSDLQTKPLKGAKGKAVYKKLKDKIPKGKFSDSTILAHQPIVEIAPDLKIKLNKLLKD
jgi:predicted ATPase